MTAKTQPAPKKSKTTPERRTREYPRLEGQDAAKFLIDNGLLYHLNRVVCHPIGLTTLFEEGEDGDLRLVIIDRRVNPTGVFTAKELEIGEAKKQTFIEESGRATMERRRRALGFTVQPNESK